MVIQSSPSPAQGLGSQDLVPPGFHRCLFGKEGYFVLLVKGRAFFGLDDLASTAG